MVGAKPCSSPGPPDAKLSTKYGELLQNSTEYISLVGALQYLTWSRPEIAYYVNQVCQFMHSPTTTHLSATKRILKYIKGTLGQDILFTKGVTVVSGYTDADWGGDPDTIRSTSGFCLFFRNNPISWSAKSNQLSLEDLQKLRTNVYQHLKDLYIFLPSSPQLLCDNRSSVSLA
ncbi:uncharacterized protein LOC113351945 [Papaver somniferum]|uniref:uncharacterized protein LOC113351945 n=1 Tax=Papaver somniferum TaxID=3469 RepID=UPI000E7007EF|nr:uncharacterized protein LOC113351945 [Papaver somniferum]